MKGVPETTKRVDYEMVKPGDSGFCLRLHDPPSPVTLCQWRTVPPGVSSLKEKRVYSKKSDSSTVFLATSAGVVTVRVSGDVVGEFGLEHQCRARDVAIAGDRSSEGQEQLEDGYPPLAVATDSDVLLGAPPDLRETEFGAATAVGFHEDILAAGCGEVARLHADTWQSLSEVSDVRSIEGTLIAAGGGVYRLDGTHVGLDDARDVTTRDVPRAATADGLYRLGNGWIDELEGDFHVVASAGKARSTNDTSSVTGDRAYAATRESFYEVRDGTWHKQTLPVDGQIAGMAHGETVYAVTTDGTLLAETDDGWRAWTLGLSDVRAITVAF